MMKRSKAVPRNSELQRGRSPMRKMHSSRKSGLHRSPQSSRPGHSSIRRSSSSSMKHGAPSTSKHMRPHPIQPPSPSARHGRNHSHDSTSHRRMPPKKSYEMLKRSPPPMGHGMSSRDIPARSISPHPSSSRYQSAGVRDSDPDFDPPPKKKMHRVPERYSSDRSPPHIPVSRPPLRHRSGSPDSHRGESTSHRTAVHPGMRDFALSHSSDRLSSSSHFHSQADDRVGYLHSTLEKMKREDHARLYMNEKHYGPTLDQRFSSDSNRGIEPRIHYSRSDLQKITIDIRPAVRESSPTVRRILNADEVKLVRRPSEGKKPIFDREEIKQAPRDMREDAHYENRNLSALVTSSVSHYGMTRRELENYEITRHKFDSFHGPSGSNEMRTLNDRWQRLDSKKEDASYFDRDERTQSYPAKLQRSDSFSDDDRRSIGRSYDRDYRDDVIQRSEHPYRRDDYSDGHRSLSNNPSDLRHSLSVRRKDDLPDSRNRLMSRRDDDSHSMWHSVSKNMADSGSDKMRGKRTINSRSARPISPQWEYENERNQGSSREKAPSYGPRSDRFRYPSWSEKQDPPSRSPTYFENEERYSSDVNRFRSSGRPTSGRAFRPRPYRGRSGMRGRSLFRGSGVSRGMMYSSRGMK